MICPTIMINPIDCIHKYPHRSKQILGISYKQFLQLVQQAFLHQSQRRSRLERKKNRLNAAGGGRKPILSTQSQVGLGLFYLRHLPTFEILGLGSRCQKYWQSCFSDLLVHTSYLYGLKTANIFLGNIPGSSVFLKLRQMRSSIIG